MISMVTGKPTHDLHVHETIDNRILTYGLETAYTRHVFMLFADHVMFAQQQPILLFASTGTEHFRAPPPYSHPPRKR